MIEKRIKMFAILAVLVFTLSILTGCIDYKAYQIPDEELNLVDEIAQIEQELTAEEGIIEEEIVLPELTAKKEAITAENVPQIIHVKENDFVRLTVDVHDPDQDPVSYRFSQPLSEQGEWKTNYGDAGEYLIHLSATDGRLTTNKKIQLVVERVNVPPIISGIKDITAKEGETIQFNPAVRDPNNDQVEIIISDPLAEKTFVTDHTSAGEYKITVTANDGELESSNSFLLTINDVNVLPVISGVEDLRMEEGETVRIAPVVNDLDEDPIQLTIGDPIGNDGVWKTGYTNHGEYVITITAHDGKDSVQREITIVVDDVNMPPEIIAVTLKN